MKAWHAPIALGLALTLGLVTACGQADKPAAAEPAVKDTLLQSQTEALDKARQVETLMQNAASAQQAQIDAAGQ